MTVPRPIEPRRDVGRRALALWGVLLWVLGFEVGPDLHIVLHGQIGAHVHGVAVDHDHDHDHDHVDDHVHDHAHDHAHGHADALVRGPVELGVAQDARDARHAAVSTVDPQHGRHDLAHRGIAVLVPDVATPRVADADLASLPRLEPHSTFVFDRTPLHDRARGPPAARECPFVNRPA